MHITPFWTTDEYYNLHYTSEYFRDINQLDEWKIAGHHLPSTTIAICPVTSPTEFSTKIESYFNHLHHIGICFHLLLPGHYLPLHRDAYGFYTKKYEITNIDKIHRYIMFLEDSQPGHFLIVGDTVHSKWNAGDVQSFSGATAHSAINLGMTPRYTLQITGIVNE
jgi:hypothetical protein